MITRTTRLGAALVLALTAVLTTACAGTTPPASETTESADPSPSTSAPEAEPSTEPSEVPTADPTCETIISESVVADFNSVGWTARTDPFYIGETELPDGLLCVWADFEAAAGDHLQLFGWSPIESDVASEAQDTLVDQGWIREEAADGVYITESPETIIAADDEGYGMTYFFGDGWVKVADTKQGLVLIEWPPAA